MSFGVSVVGAVGAGALGLSWLRGLPCSETVFAAYVLVVALVIGCIGGMLILQRRDRLAAAVLLAAGFVPGLVEPKAFVATFLLVLAGFLTTGHARPATE